MTAVPQVKAEGPVTAEEPLETEGEVTAEQPMSSLKLVSAV